MSKYNRLRKKRKHWSKLTTKEAENRARLDAGLITFNRHDHPATKFREL